MPARIDVIGKVFGRATVIGDGPHRVGQRRRVICRCECGTTFNCEPRSLMQGHTKSCGCWHREVVGKASASRTTHGMTRTTEYNTWLKIRDRCYNPRSRKYAEYGGRGVAVSRSWRDNFDAFLADMGPKPFPSASIDRIDVDGPYSAENCRWADPKTQSRNKRNHRLVDHDGRVMPLSEACELTGINYRSALWRINNGRHWRPCDGQ